VLKDHLIKGYSVYEDLLEDRENLGALPRKWLEYLEEIIECR